MRRKKSCYNPALSFGLGMLIGAFFPARFVLCIAAVIIILLAVATAKY